MQTVYAKTRLFIWTVIPNNQSAEQILINAAVILQKKITSLYWL